MRRAIGLSMAAVMAVSLAGCSGGQKAAETTAAAETAEAASEAASKAAEEEVAESLAEKAETTQELSWDMAEEILTHISDPEFPDYSVNVLDYGAVADDGKLDTEAIQKAIDEVSEKGGGKVIIPSGGYDTGAITLKSNVNLCLEAEDTILKFTKDITVENYPLVFAHYEGSKVYNWSPFIYAYQEKNIAVTGKGTLDGQADKDTWWNWCRVYNADGTTSNPSSPDAKALRKMTDEGVPAEDRVFGEGHFLRPNFVQPIECENVLIEGDYGCQFSDVGAESGALHQLYRKRRNHRTLTATTTTAVIRKLQLRAD